MKCFLKMIDSFPLPESKKVYFASDLHLGMYPGEESARRERLIVSWLDEIKQDAAALFLLGDVFDFWFEYKRVVPKGHVRFLGRLAELADRGVAVHIFAGNHDTWLCSYFQRELGAQVHLESYETRINDALFFMAHGDGVGPVRWPYRWMRRLFRCHTARVLYAALPSSLGVGFGLWWARHSVLKHARHPKNIVCEKDPSYLFAAQHAAEHDVQYYLFGHLHRVFDVPLPSGSRYLNIGDGVSHYSYAVYDGSGVSIKTFAPPSA